MIEDSFVSFDVFLDDCEQSNLLREEKEGL